MPELHKIKKIEMNDPIIKAALIIAGSLLISIVIIMYPTYKCIAIYDNDSISLCISGT